MDGQSICYLQAPSMEGHGMVCATNRELFKSMEEVQGITGSTKTVAEATKVAINDKKQLA